MRWDESIDAIVTAWKGYAEKAEYKMGLEALLTLLRQKRTDRYLVDCRDLAPITQEDQRYTNTDWFPRIINAGLRYIAIISPKSAVAKLSVRQILSRVNNVNLLTAHFDDMEAARQWIKTEGR